MKRPASFYTKNYFHKRDHLDLHIAESVKILAIDNSLNTILDVGCGTGRLVKFLNKHGFHSYGIDPYAPLPKNKYFSRAQATKIPFRKASFDLVTSVSVIEHLTKKESKRFIKEVYRVLKPKGYVFLITPNFDSPLRFALGKKWFGYSDPTHINFFTPQSLEKLLKKYGFTGIRFQFKTLYNPPYNWGMPGFVNKLPLPIRSLLTYLFITTPFALLRDSFWISAQRR